MKTEVNTAISCFGHWFQQAFEGVCVSCGCKIQDVCRIETLMRERLKEDAAYLEPDHRLCGSGNCD